MKTPPMASQQYFLDCQKHNKNAMKKRVEILDARHNRLHPEFFVSYKTIDVGSAEWNWKISSFDSTKSYVSIRLVIW